jgi:sulfate permease, SulP family
MTSDVPPTALFAPKLVTVLREGYGFAGLRADAMAGLTVAVVALPLSMAIAIASGTMPERGLYTAIVGGFFISALGGSRFQVGGPAGAFIVLVAACVARHGIEGTVLATFMAGLFLMAAGAFRLGTFIKFIPYPVTVGFTAGIAVIILASQLRDLFGLTLAGREPGEFMAKIEVLAEAWGTVNAASVALALLTIGGIAGLKRLRPHWPGMLLAVAAASLATFVLGLPVETIGSRFGGIPSLLPMLGLPDVSLAKIEAVLPDAVAFALLGAIESLLSAVVADGMTGRRHRPNVELVAQGVANIGAALFGGIPATGTIARTATNVRAGARGPVAGMLHSVFLLVFMLLAAPLAAYIPLAALAGVLAVVAWNMAEKHEFATLLRSSRGDAVVLLATFLLTVFRDLTEGIVVGSALGAVLFIHRMTGTAAVEEQRLPPFAPELTSDPDIVVYRLSGAFFFGTASTVGTVLDRIADRHKAFVIDLAAVPFIDSTAANVIAGIGRKAARHGVRVYVTGAAASVRRALLRAGAGRPKVRYLPKIEDAVRAAHETV